MAGSRPHVGRSVFLAALMVLGILPALPFAPAAEATTWPGPDGRGDPVLLAHGYALFPTNGFAPVAYFGEIGSQLAAKGWETHFVDYYGCDSNGEDIGAHGSHQVHFLPSDTGPSSTWAQQHDSGCGGNGHSRSTSIEHLGYHFAWYVKEMFTDQGRCVRIVTHSMGGDVVRYALAQVGKNTAFPTRMCVREVVTLSTPQGGTRFYTRAGTDYEAGELSRRDTHFMDWMGEEARPPSGTQLAG